MALRWRMAPARTGLHAVGAGPRSHHLYLDNHTPYLATVMPNGGDWRRPLKGWYWVIPSQTWTHHRSSHLMGMKPYATPEEAKAVAMAYVKQNMPKDWKP